MRKSEGVFDRWVGGPFWGSDILRSKLQAGASDWKHQGQGLPREWGLQVQKLCVGGVALIEESRN